MLNALKIILKSPSGQLEEDEAIDRINRLAEAIDLSLRNIKFGDDIESYLADSKVPEQCKAIVEVITGFIDTQQHIIKVSEEKPVTTEPQDFVLNAHNAHKQVTLYFRTPQPLLNKIGAIKSFRVLFGCGLKEAKDFVDALGGLLVKSPLAPTTYINTEAANCIVELRNMGVNILYTFNNE